MEGGGSLPVPVARKWVRKVFRFLEPRPRARYTGALFTFMSAGLVENLSLRSPCSSYSSTTRSTVQTANLALLWDQAMQVTFAAPSCRGKAGNDKPKCCSRTPKAFLVLLLLVRLLSVFLQTKRCPLSILVSQALKP